MKIPSIEKITASLAAAPSTMPSHAPSPARPASPSLRRTVYSPMTAPTKGPSKQARDTEEEPHQGAERGADDRSRARAHPFRAEGGGRQVHGVGQRGQDPQAHESARAHMGEAVDPRGEQEPAKYEGRTGQRGQHGTRDPDQHQHGREDPEQDRGRHVVGERLAGVPGPAFAAVQSRACMRHNRHSD